jgi:hypothetical protein
MTTEIQAHLAHESIEHYLKETWTGFVPTVFLVKMSCHVMLARKAWTKRETDRGGKMKVAIELAVSAEYSMC